MMCVNFLQVKCRKTVHDRAFNPSLFVYS
ncbi:hypothetical protein MARINON1_20429 [Marinobacter salarius]|nr:hypothetical protein MBHK15_80176 [Marinobacter salarius]VXB08146.1 hypothetical protein MARINON1_20429 [Marinobacter salarius]